MGQWQDNEIEAYKPNCKYYREIGFRPREVNTISFYCDFMNCHITPSESCGYCKTRCERIEKI